MVILCTGEWEERLEALRLGATDVLRCQPTDIDLTLIRMMREKEYADSAPHESPCPAWGTLEAPGVLEYSGGIGELKMRVKRLTA